MKETLENVMLMGLGALAMTNEKAKELKEDLLKRGTEAYENGKILNEELKHNISEKIRDKVTVVVEKPKMTKEDLAEEIEKLSDEDKKEMLKLLRKNKKDINNE